MIWRRRVRVNASHVLTYLRICYGLNYYTLYSHFVLSHCFTCGDIKPLCPSLKLILCHIMSHLLYHNFTHCLSSFYCQRILIPYLSLSLSLTHFFSLLLINFNAKVSLSYFNRAGPSSCSETERCASATQSLSRNTHTHLLSCCSFIVVPNAVFNPMAISRAILCKHF